MGKQGRFGKYGDTKRLERLRQSRIRSLGIKKSGFQAWESSGMHRKKIDRKNPLVLRTAVPTDLQYIRSLSRKVFNRFGPYEDLLPGWFEAPGTNTIMALMDKRAVGFAMLGELPQGRLAIRLAEVLAIAVEPSRQKFGIGTALMEELERRALKEEVKALFLHTGLTNYTARALFEKRGFMDLDIKKCFYPQGQDAVMMYKEIPMEASG